MQTARGAPLRQRLVAVGSLGRREPAPHGDLDLVLAGVLSLAMGLYCFSLPHTPPPGRTPRPAAEVAVTPRPGDPADLENALATVRREVVDEEVADDAGGVLAVPAPAGVDLRREDGVGEAGLVLERDKYHAARRVRTLAAGDQPRRAARPVGSRKEVAAEPGRPAAIVDRPPLVLPDNARVVVWPVVNVEVWDIGRPMPRQVLPPRELKYSGCFRTRIASASP